MKKQRKKRFIEPATLVEKCQLRLTKEEKARAEELAAEYQWSESKVFRHAFKEFWGMK